MRLRGRLAPIGRALGKLVLAALAGGGMAGAAFAALDVSMTVPAPYSALIYPGDVTAFRITLTNSSTASSVTGVGFTDTMPGGLIVAGMGVKSYTCTDGNGAAVVPSGTVTAMIGSNVITLSGGEVPIATPSVALGQCVIDVEVTSQVAGSAPVNVIPAGGVTGTEGATPVSNGTAAQQSITVRSLNLPEIRKAFAPSTLPKGGTTTTLTITIDNSANPSVNLPLNGAGDSPAYAIRDILPSNIEVAGTPNATAVCTGAGTAPTFTPAAGDTTLTAVGGTVAGGGTCTLTVKLVALGAATTAAQSSNVVTNTIDRTNDFKNRRGLVPAQNASAPLTVTSGLTIAETFNPGTVAAGQSATLTVTIRNTGANVLTLDAGNALTVDRIDGLVAQPYGLTVTNTATNAACGGGVASITPDTRGFTLAGGVLAANAICTITITYTGTLQTPGTPQSFGNTIPLGAVQVTSDPSVASPQVSASVNVIDQLTVTKTVSPANPAPGAPVRYTVAVRNYSGYPLSQLMITDALPGGLTALSAGAYAPSVSGDCSGIAIDVTAPATPILTVTSVLAGPAPPAPSVCTVVFWAQVPTSATAGTALNNSLGAGAIVATSGGPGSPTITNSGGSNVSITLADPITINKSFAQTSVSEGTTVPLTFTLSNASATSATAAAFSDAFPIDSSPAHNGNQLVVASPANASTTCVGGSITATAGASSVALAGATIPARGANGTGALGACTVTVSVIAGAGTYQNILPVGALVGMQQPAGGGAPVSKSSPGPITSTVNFSSSLTATKAFAPSTIASGGISTVTIHLENVGAGTLNNISVVDPLPAGLTVAATPNAYTTCGGAPVITAAAGASSVSLTGAIVPAAGQCNLLFNVTGTGGAAWVNTIPSGNISADGGVRNVTAVSATLNNSTSGGVAVTVATSPPSLTSPGQVALLTITLTNTGTTNLSGLALTNYFTTNGLAGGTASGLIIAGQPNAATTCTGGLVSAAAGGASVGLTSASLVAGANCTVTVNVTLTTTGTVTDLIPVAAVTSSQGVSNPLASSTSLSAGANLGVTKTFLPGVIKPTEISRLRVTLINAQAIAASNLTFTDTLPAGVTIAAVPNTTTSCTGGTVTAIAGSGSVGLSGGSLPAAAAGSSTLCLVEVDVTAAASGTYLNTIPAGGLTGQLGGGSASNPSPATATLQVRSPVAIAKSFAQATRTPGQPDMVTLTLTNPNAVALTAAALTDTLPANLTVALTPNAATSCVGGNVNAAASATSVVLTGATIPAGGSCTVTFDVLSNISGSYINTIPAGALATAQGVTNELPVSATVTIINPPTVSKQFSPVSIAAGGVSTLSIVLGNTNATAATLTSALIDTLPTSPAPILVAPVPNIGGACTTASVTAAAGAATVTYASGATIPSGGCTITLDVTGATEGNYVNTIPVGGLQTNVGSNVQPTNAPLTITPLGFISGRVFRDGNVTPNGVYDAGDTAIAGVGITLSGTDYGADGVAGGGDDTVIARSTTTDALGNYAFTGLNPGAYTVTEPTQPTGTNNGITTAGAVSGAGGGTPGTATPIGTTPSVVATIVLLKDGGGRVSSSPGNNFAEVVPSSISGFVFLDQNNNGVQNVADTALAGVTVELLSGGVVIQTTTTDSAGAYTFGNLAPGAYTVREPTQPTGTANGQTIAGPVANGGTAGTPSTPATLPSTISGIVLPPATAATANNFAEQPSGRQVSGRVFLDANNDGLFNGADTALANVPLNLTGTDINGFAVTASQVSGSDGRYVFTGLAEGTYTVTEAAQPGGTNNGITTAGSAGGVATIVTVTPSAIASIPLTGATTASTDNNFGEVAAPIVATPGSVSGKVYVDANNDGMPDPAEAGIANVTVTLTGTSSGGATVNLSTITAADGTFLFTNVPASGAGGYTLTETQPSTYGDGKTTLSPGSTGSAVSNKPIASNGADLITGVTVVASGAATGYNFGERSGGVIAGFVYVDVNNDGVKNNGEAPIVGVTVTLTGHDANGAVVNLTTTTGNDGGYSFTGLLPSDAAGYTVTQVQPAGYVDGKTSIATGNPGTAGVGKPIAVGGADVIGGIVLTGGATLANYNFGEARLTGQIAGFVYVDADNNGVKDAGETGIAGVVVRLTGKDASGAAVSLTTTTAIDGGYGFTGLSPSDAAGYTVSEIQPSDYVDGRTSIATGNPGTAGAGKPIASGGSDSVGGIVLAGGAALTNYNFGETRPTSLISGFVYVDADNNGVKDAGETPLAGITVRLTGRDATGIAVSVTTTTGADGSYAFANLTASDAAGYTISELQPAGYTDGKTSIATGNPGTAGAGKPIAAGGADIVSGVVLPVGGQLTHYDFGEARLVGLISGFVYLDANNDGVKGADEAPLAGVTVRLTGKDASGATVSLTTTTGADGGYSFTGLLASDAAGYTIGEVQPAGYADGKTSITTGNPGTAGAGKPIAIGGTDIVSGVVLTAGAQLTRYDFGETRLTGQISGFVYLDLNNNGVKDTDEAPLPGVTVRLTGKDVTGATVTLTTTSGADGAYSFTNVVASDAAGYTITELQPAGYVDGKTSITTGNPGTAGVGKPIAVGGTDIIGGVVLPAGGQLTRYDFGEGRITGIIAGYVYIDANANGLKEASESGIAGVTVRLVGTSRAGVAVSLTQITDAAGAFRFTDVPASDATGYRIVETQPSGYTDGRTTIPAGNPGTTTSRKPVNVGDQDAIGGVVATETVNLVDYAFGEIAIPTLKPPIVNGYVWFDRTHNRIRPTDGTVEGQVGWTVTLRQNGTLICTTTTDQNGFYQFDNLHCVGYEANGLPIGSGFSISFSRDGNNLPNVPTSGDGRGQVSGNQIVGITLRASDQVVEQNLPLDPAGVVYNSVTRQTVAGALVAIAGPAGFNPATMLVGGTAAQSQTTGSDGLYQFLLQNGFPSGVYTLSVAAPAGYVGAPSTALPPCTGTLNVGPVPNPALIQAGNFAPATSVPTPANVGACPGLVAGGANSTQYYLAFGITNGTSAPILNNHIPLDPAAQGSLFVTKTTPLVNVSRGSLVPYTITASNRTSAPILNVQVRDILPPGFKVREGSASENGRAVTPVISQGQVTWPLESFAANGKNSYNLILVVGAGVGDGDYVNRALAVTPAGGAASNTASATVRLIPDPTFDCPDVIGKVFDDKNANGYQDAGEPGIPGVRVVTPDGLLVTSDADGRYHVPCPAVPNADRGSNFVMKLDVRTLPSGFRLTTENPRDVRITRGKLVKLDFGATAHRVVRIELSGAAFEAGKTDLIEPWKTQLANLPALLDKQPSVVRIAYDPGGDPPGLVRDREQAVARQIRDAWHHEKRRYALAVEMEGAR